MLFEKSNLKSLELKNRVFRSATHEGMATSKGYPTKNLHSLYKHLVRGQVACIITGYMGVMQNGKSSLRNMLMIDKDEHIEYYKSLVEDVHENGGKIIAQLAHCGSQTKEVVTKESLLSPSGKKDLAFGSSSREMSENEIEEVIEAFVKGGLRAKESGFDGIQLHIAHGYLLCQFISPYTNMRKDKWGGSLENRFRIVEEILKKLRKNLGDDYPIIVKLNICDNRPGGLRVEESKIIAKLLEKHGCDGIELSCGVVEDGFYLARGNTPKKAMAYFSNNLNYMNVEDERVEGEKTFNLEGAKLIKKEINIPVILVGGIRDKGDIEKVLNDGIDYVSMSRALIIEPDLIRSYEDEKKDSSNCLSCNYCIIGAEVNPLKCYFSTI